METSKTDEEAFEALIEKALVGSTVEERANKVDVESQHPEEGMYYWGLPKDMDNTLAIDLRRLWSFLDSTQAEELAKYKGGDIRKDLPRYIKKNIDTYGVLKVLREPLKLNNITIYLFFPKPTAADSEAARQKYQSNQFSITRQLTFSLIKPSDEIDMALFVNGLPLFTFELKNPWTKQTAFYDGQKQWRDDRDPHDPLLQYGRCLAHFTIDKNEVFFTTKLDGKKTFFMPFNQGLPEGQGAGNPVNPNGYKISYMWENILRRDTVADIIGNYSLFDYGEAKTGKKVAHIMRNAKKLIFPRYHQLDAVTKLIADVEENGVGKRYLIEHSAGSGKSNTLTWLAYKLLGACPTTMSAKRARALDKVLFNSIIVVTDRRILDQQISANIKAFGKSPNIIAHAESSSELKKAIEDGKRIIITTIQKFPFICDSIADVSNHNFAIIIDEAHSSQTGKAAGMMNATVQKDEDTDGSDTDELIEKMIKEKKMSTNCSYFAFTATPKRETLERFGTRHEDGKFYPFHLYSMKQAIEEGFILDVLTNYTTYHSYYELRKSIEDNPLYNDKRAQKILKAMVEKDEHTIAAKADVILTHFDAKVFRSHKLKSKGKAMVVTKDIECAIRYYQALQKLRKERRLPYNILIAFSGTKEVDGVEYSETGINGFAEKNTPEEFDKDDNRILVVANKYLTGFDQPKLCAMYIDKPLDGVIAVQALSRLNRAAPELGKRSEDLFILDFYNTIKDMKDSFDPYYTGTLLSEPTNVNTLHELRDTLLSFDVFSEEDVNKFADLYVHGAEGDKLAPIIDAAADQFNNVIEWAENGKADFKMKCKQFVRIYSRVAAIMDFEMVDWEKLYWFLRLLIPELKVDGPESDGIKDLLDDVDLNTYGLRRTALNEQIDLAAETAIIDPTKAKMVNAGEPDDTKDPLDQILDEFNEHHFKGWEATPDDQKAKLISIAKSVAEDSDYQNLVVGNPDQNATEAMMTKIIDRIIRQKRKGDMSLYREYQKNDDFKYNMRNVITRMLGNADYLFSNQR